MTKVLYLFAIFLPAFFSCLSNKDESVTKHKEEPFISLKLNGPSYEWDQVTFQKWLESLALLEREAGANLNLHKMPRNADPKFQTNQWVERFRDRATKLEHDGYPEAAKIVRKFAESMQYLFKYFDAQNTLKNSDVGYYVVPQYSSFPIARVPYGQKKRIVLKGPEGTVFDIYQLGDLMSALEFGFAPESYLKKHSQGVKKFQVNVSDPQVKETQHFAKKQELPLKDFSQDDSTTPLLKSSRRSSSGSSSEEEIPDFLSALSDGGAAGAGQSSLRSSYGSTSPMSTGSSASTSPSSKGKEKVGGYVPPSRI